MHILFLSDNFPPESNAPAARLYEHAMRWAAAGHEITVITCAPNFPEGKLFEGYRNKWYDVEMMDGVRVVRVKTYITANAGFLKRTLDYVSFMVTGFVAGLFQRRPDVIVGTSPQFFCAVGAWALAAVRRKPFVFELRDLWPASIVAVGAMKESRVIRFLEKTELFLYRRACAIVPVTEAFRKDLVARGVCPEKIHVVRNGVDLSRYHPMSRDADLEREYGLQDRLVVGYLGTHGLAHGLGEVVDAAELLRGREDIVFLFVGGGVARGDVEKRVANKGLENVRLLPRQPRKMMPRLWSLCDVSLVPLRDNPVFATVIPSKLFESMAMGVPVVASLPEGEATGIVREAEVGEVVPPDDPTALAAAVSSLKDTPERLAALRAACLKVAPRFSRERQAERMLELLKEIVDVRQGAASGSRSGMEQ